MKDTIAYINDRRVKNQKAAISVFDYTLHCGVGLFESILGVDNRLIYLDQHLDRLELGIKRLDVNFNYNRQRLTATLEKLVKEHPARVKKIKIILTIGYSPLWPGDKPEPSTICMAIPHRLEFKRQKVILSPMIITPANPMRGLKMTNFGTEWMSQYRAAQAGYNQGIIVNNRGYIAETGSANLFMVRDGRLFTPPVISGGLPGTIRGKVIEIAHINRIPCREKKIKPEMLAQADEIFTTSSFKLIWPVVELKLDRTYKFEPGPVARALFNCLKSIFLDNSDDLTLNL